MAFPIYPAEYSFTGTPPGPLRQIIIDPPPEDNDNAAAAAAPVYDVPEPDVPGSVAQAPAAPAPFRVLRIDVGGARRFQERQQARNSDDSPAPRSPDALLQVPKPPRSPLTPRRGEFASQLEAIDKKLADGGTSTYKKWKLTCTQWIMQCAPGCILKEVRCASPLDNGGCCCTVEKRLLVHLKKSMQCVTKCAGCCAAIPCCVESICCVGRELRQAGCCSPRNSATVVPLSHVTPHGN